MSLIFNCRSYFPCPQTLESLNAFIVNNTGVAPDLTAHVLKMAEPNRLHFIQQLHNNLLIGFCCEDKKRVHRTLEVLEYLYHCPTLAQTVSNSNPDEFRWDVWQRQRLQRSANKNFVPPILDPGIAAFLLLHEQFVPSKFKGTLNAMSEEEGCPLQWGRSFGLFVEAKKVAPFLRQYPQMVQSLEQWNVRVEHGVLLQVVDTPNAPTRARKM